jgi:2-methylcitrate dehydratase PrpD
MTVAHIFAEFGAHLRPQDLSPEVIHHAKRAVVDWYAAWLPGSIEPPATLLETALRDDLDRGSARLAQGRLATPRTAAFINATAAHTVEVDDIYREAIYHPGAPTIAAALAIAQAEAASGLAFLTAVVAGYEISTRIGAAMGREHYRYWHNTGTVGTFGAAAAAAHLLKLGAHPFAHSLCTATTFAAGLQQAFRMDSMSKPLHAGHAAQAGLLAAQSAAAGVTGSGDVIDGEAGFGKAAQARFSIPYVVATALLYGSVRLAAFSPERLTDPAIRDLMTQIELSVDPALDAAFPGQRAAHVQIELKEGRSASFFQPTRKGDPEDPLTDADLSDKFMELVTPVLGHAPAARLLQKLWHLDHCNQVSSL